MKYQILLLAVTIVALSSCTTAYKTGQTPDDVYFSPTRGQDEYVRVEKRDDRRYQSMDEYYDDRFLRMRVRNRHRWSALDDYYMFDNPYAYNYYSYYSSWNNPWNSYWAWNNYYNPYCRGAGYYFGGVGGVIVKYPTTISRPPGKPLAFNPRSYIGNTGSTQTRTFKGVTNSYNSTRGYSDGRYNNNNRSNYNYYDNSNNGRSSNSNYNPSNSTPSRSYTPSSSSSSSSSSGGSSSGGSSRPPR